jgi:wee1-like protein kinase
MEEEAVPDLTKADIFSLGVTAYELITKCDLPCNGEEWHDLREGRLHRLDAMSGVSHSLKDIIRKMLASNPDARPSAKFLLANYLPSEIELELKWQKIKNNLLRDQIAVYKDQMKTKRKNSI